MVLEKIPSQSRRMGHQRPQLQSLPPSAEPIPQFNKRHPGITGTNPGPSGYVCRLGHRGIASPQDQCCDDRAESETKHFRHRAAARAGISWHGRVFPSCLMTEKSAKAHAEHPSVMGRDAQLVSLLMLSISLTCTRALWFRYPSLAPLLPLTLST